MALAALGMHVGMREAAGTLFPQVATRLSKETLAELCATCPWYDLGYCAEGIAAGKIATGWQETPAENYRNVDGK